jgi:integrase
MVEELAPDVRHAWSFLNRTDFVKLVEEGQGSAKHGVMTPHELNLSKPIGQWKRAWYTAKKRAGVKCRLHDLRHHFITNLAETQTSDSTILVIAGHLSRKMLERYSHIRSEAKRAAVEAMEPTSLHDSGSHL